MVDVLHILLGSPVIKIIFDGIKGTDSLIVRAAVISIVIIALIKWNRAVRNPICCVIGIRSHPKFRNISCILVQLAFRRVIVNHIQVFYAPQPLQLQQFLRIHYQLSLGIGQGFVERVGIPGLEIDFQKICMISILISCLFQSPQFLRDFLLARQRRNQLIQLPYLLLIL